MDILVILGEVILLIWALVLGNWIIGIVFKQVIKISKIKGAAEGLEKLRNTVSRLFIFAGVVLSVLLIGANSLLIYQGKNLREFQLNLINSIPVEFWMTLGIGILKSVSLLMLVGFSIKPMQRLLDLAGDRVKKYEQFRINQEKVEEIFEFIKNQLTNIIWIVAIILSAQFLYVPESITHYLYVGLRIYIIITVGLLILKAISNIIDYLDWWGINYSNDPDNLLRFYAPLRHLVPLLKKCLEYVVYVSLATLIVKEVEFIAWMAPIGTRIIQVIAVLFLSRVLVEIANLLVEEILLKDRKLTEYQRQRRLTIIPLIQSFLKYVIYFTGAIATLRIINIDPTPILAAAGILGLAVGFGAQNLVNDMVCGFFILFENYYLVGDFIEIKGVSGFVESIDLRATRIRNSNGQQHIIRNGEIKDITNYSKQYINAIVEIGVSYETNLDRAYQAIEKIGIELQKNYPDVQEPTVVDGLDNFGQYSLVIRTRTKVKPGTHLRIQRVLRKMIKDAFDREGIEIPFARQMVIFKNEQNQI